MEKSSPKEIPVEEKLKRICQEHKLKEERLKNL